MFILCPSVDKSASSTSTCCAPPSLQVTLEKVLGITAVGNSGLACDPRSGLVAYPAGWEGGRCRLVVHPYLNIWYFTYQPTMHRMPSYHIYLSQMLCVQMSVSVRYLCTVIEWRRSRLFFHQNSKASLYRTSPREVSFETLWNTLLCRTLCSVIYPVQTVTLAVLTLIWRGSRQGHQSRCTIRVPWASNTFLIMANHPGNLYLHREGKQQGMCSTYFITVCAKT